MANHIYGFLLFLLLTPPFTFATEESHVDEYAYDHEGYCRRLSGAFHGACVMWRLKEKDNKVKGKSKVDNKGETPSNDEFLLEAKDNSGDLKCGGNIEPKVEIKDVGGGNIIFEEEEEAKEVYHEKAIEFLE
ncbi:hypothetical protein SUGI_0914930 [Cryptomeria japonica]|nr:hypothetical protein SUGI_0914930 [Cryptomeria japonica]